MAKCSGPTGFRYHHKLSLHKILDLVADDEFHQCQAVIQHQFGLAQSLIDARHDVGVKASLLKTSLKFSELANTIRRLLGKEVTRSPEPDVALQTGTHRGSVDWRRSAHEPDLSSFDRR